MQRYQRCWVLRGWRKLHRWQGLGKASLLHKQSIVPMELWVR